MSQVEKAKEPTMGRELEKTRDQHTRTPHVDIYENETELFLVADVPGVGKDGLTLAIEPPELRLEATPSDPAQARFRRAFTIDERIAAGDVSAELVRGVLTVRLPKVKALKPRQIPIRTAP